MLFEVIRNDITKVKVATIVNTANPRPVWEVGIDAAIYKVEEENFFDIPPILMSECRMRVKEDMLEVIRRFDAVLGRTVS